MWVQLCVCRFSPAGERKCQTWVDLVCELLRIFLCFYLVNLLVFEISSSTTCTGMMWFVKCLGNLIDSTQHLLWECRTLYVVEFSICFMLYETAGKQWYKFHIISSYCRSRLPIQIISSLHAWIIIVIFFKSCDRSYLIADNERIIPNLCP